MLASKKTKQIFFFLTWLYLACICIATVLLHTQGDNWWPATLLLFGPRWILGLPLIVLIPLALIVNWRLLLPLGLSLLIFSGPFLGYNYPFGGADLSYGKFIRVLSCNTMNGNADSVALAKMIRDYSVDVVALQEAPKKFKLDLPKGWNTYHEGFLVILSRFPIEQGESVLTYHPPHKWKRHSLLASVVNTPIGRIAFHSVHLPSARYGLQNIISRKMGVDPEKADLLVTETMTRTSASKLVLSKINSTVLPSIVAGDFNMPRQSAIFRGFWGGYENAFAQTSTGYGWTFHDAFKGIPVPLAIDHVLSRNGATPLSFRIGPDIGSDHRPVIADIAINSSK
jgi:endonuclease/exonuclease/phosphatase family metal-dependent hydrolase